VRGLVDGATLDVSVLTLDALREALDLRDWRTPGLAESQILLDKTGELTAVHAALRRMTDATAKSELENHCGAYLNGFFRSLQAWSIGDELGARLHASRSVIHLIGALFALEARWPPYPDWVSGGLTELEPQGWDSAKLETDLIAILATADPTTQQDLEARVEALLRRRGQPAIIESWFGELDRVKAVQAVAQPR
jgi:Domain of unknown function (DUF4037)